MKELNDKQNMVCGLCASFDVRTGWCHLVDRFVDFFAAPDETQKGCQYCDID